MSNITKNALAEALLELMRTKRLDRISVKEISEVCGLNRHTFYYHFRDIDDLLNWTCAQKFERSTMSIRTLEWPERFTQLMRVLLENRSIVCNAMRSVPFEQCARFIDDRVEDWILPALNARLKDDRDALLITGTCRTLLSATVMKWIENDMTESPEAVTERLLYVLKRLADVIPDEPLVKP